MIYTRTMNVPIIVLNVPWTYKKLHYKGEPYWFSCWRLLKLKVDTQKDRQTAYIIMSLPLPLLIYPLSDLTIMHNKNNLVNKIMK